LHRRFDVTDVTYFPTRLPLVDLNLVIGLTCTPACVSLADPRVELLAQLGDLTGFAHGGRSPLDRGRRTPTPAGDDIGKLIVKAVAALAEVQRLLGLTLADAGLPREPYTGARRGGARRDRAARLRRHGSDRASSPRRNGGDPRAQR